MRRGQIWTRSETEAFVLCGADAIVTNRPVVFGLPISAQPTKAKPPLALRLSPTATGLGVETWVKLIQGITSLRVDHLNQQVGLLNDKALDQLSIALRQMYDLD